MPESNAAERSSPESPVGTPQARDDRPFHDRLVDAFREDYGREPTYTDLAGDGVNPPEWVIAYRDGLVERFGGEVPTDG